jgi:hypothetical protein
MQCREFGDGKLKLCTVKTVSAKKMVSDNMKLSDNMLSFFFVLENFTHTYFSSVQ